MSTVVRANVHTTDSAWMAWLRKCSKLVGTSDETLYVEFTQNKPAWQLTVQRLRNGLFPGWPFLHGQLSSTDISSARCRYLDKYPLTAEQQDSATYVDALLSVEESQLRVRQDSHDTSCVGCADRDRTIRQLRVALSNRGLRDESSITVAAITAMFRRHFMLDRASATSRTEVREVIERAFQCEVSPDETLRSGDLVWGRFIRESLGISGASGGPIRCRLRQHVLAAETV